MSILYVIRYMLYGVWFMYKCDLGVKLNNYFSYVYVYIYIDYVLFYFFVILEYVYRVLL